MKLFTSLTASAAFAQAQDFPGFGGSLADLLAQLNIENQLDLGIGGAVAAGNDANVNATEGEFDPITGERYLIADTGPDPNTPFANNCDPNTPNTAAEDCNPCMFDPSVCNFDPNACRATETINGQEIPLGIHDNDSPGTTEDDWWIYECDCTDHINLQHRTDLESDTWAGPECQCTRCTPFNGSTAADNGEVAHCIATDPCTVLSNDPTKFIDELLAEPANSGGQVCYNTPDSNAFTCACDDGYYGYDCSNTLPCLSADLAPSTVCNGAPGTNDLANDSCTCDCPNHPDNLTIPYTWGGTTCHETICETASVTCSNGSLNDNTSQNPAVCECICDVNYSGVDCSFDDCGTHTCVNGTVDRSVQGQCGCTCPAGFTGAQCEIPTSTPTGTGCWKCDAMTYVQCATEGTFQTCSEDNTNGDNGVCFVEYREQNQKLTQLCTGCKDAKSCDNLKRQNFVPGFEAGNTAPFMRMRNQCKPDYRLQVARRRYGNTQSVCRQCFSMCSNADANSATNCFGGLGNSLIFTAAATNEDKIGAAQWIRYYKNIVGGPESNSSPWNNGDGGSTDKLLRNGAIADNEAIVLGIPLHMVADDPNEIAIVDSPLNHIFRGYTKTALTNLIIAQNDDHYVVGQPLDISNPLYWTLADATDYFWQNNLIQEQGTNEAQPFPDAFDANGYDFNIPCELDYGAGNRCDRY